MKLINDDRTVIFDTKEEFYKNFNVFSLTLWGYPCKFNFAKNDSLSFTLKDGFAVQDGLNFTPDTKWEKEVLAEKIKRELKENSLKKNS